MLSEHNGGGGIQAAPATTRSHRPMAEIPIFLRHAPVSTSTALRSASTPNRSVKEELEFQPSAGVNKSLQRQPGTHGRRCAVVACSELWPLDADDRITGAV